MSHRQAPPVRSGASSDVARLARRFGSLYLAVCLLPTFAAVLFLGTVVESWHDRPTARQLVYQTWWFAALLLLLGLNVTCAALKKWPWQRHQTGFLVTHAGLITLVAGGLIDSLFGASGMMVLVDSAGGPGPGRPGAIPDRTAPVLRVQRPRLGPGDALRVELNPGPVARTADGRQPTPADPLTAALALLARPLPGRWAWDLGDGARVEVLEYHPAARQEPYRPTGRDEPA